jgi:hypothetical protein
MSVSLPLAPLGTTVRLVAKTSLMVHWVLVMIHVFIFTHIFLITILAERPESLFFAVREVVFISWPVAFTRSTICTQAVAGLLSPFIPLSRFDRFWFLVREKDNS